MTSFHLFSLVKEALLIINLIVTILLTSFFFQGRVREDFHQENLDSERIALTLNTRTTIIAREMLENLHTFHRHLYRQVALNY